jgi:hypothetical protein
MTSTPVCVKVIQVARDFITVSAEEEIGEVDEDVVISHYGSTRIPGRDRSTYSGLELLVSHWWGTGLGVPEGHVLPARTVDAEPQATVVGRQLIRRQGAAIVVAPRSARVAEQKIILVGARPAPTAGNPLEPLVTNETPGSHGGTSQFGISTRELLYALAAPVTT